MSRSKPSRLRVSSVSFLLSRKVVRPTIVSTVNPSKFLCIDGNVISKEYLNTPLAYTLSSHRHSVSFRKEFQSGSDVVLVLVVDGREVDKTAGGDDFIWHLSLRQEEEEEEEEENCNLIWRINY